MGKTFESFSVVPTVYGCTNKESLNYNANAEKDNGTCIDSGFTKCIQNAITTASLKDCDLETSHIKLEIYTYYQSLEISLREGNQYKINMYKDKLAELCNMERCDSC